MADSPVGVSDPGCQCVHTHHGPCLSLSTCDTVCASVCVCSRRGGVAALAASAILLICLYDLFVYTFSRV